MVTPKRYWLKNCKRGHPLSGDNLRPGVKTRQCLACYKLYQQLERPHRWIEAEFSIEEELSDSNELIADITSGSSEW